MRTAEKFFFVAKKPEPFSEYFKYIGFDILVDRENGVIMLQNDRSVSETRRIQANRVQLKKIESIILCCLWTIYADRVSSGSLKKDIIIPITDLRFELEKYGLKDRIDNKTMMGNTLDTLKKYNLLEVIGKVGDPDCRICIYPSIQFALNGEEFKSFADKASERFLNTMDTEEFDEEDADEFDE